MKKPITISVILATTLRDYKGAADDRPRKLQRAIASVIQQSYKNWELLVMCDGCAESYAIAQVFRDKDKRVKPVLLPQSSLWSGVPRNMGQTISQAPVICYIDNDDYFDQHHLQFIHDNIQEYDWIYFDDLRWSEIRREWYVNFVHINKAGFHGTSNIAYRKELRPAWPLEGNYLHDHYFVEQLLEKGKKRANVGQGQYHVCHIPPNIHTTGYDI
jgi:glycosyltransferase involved in cell wall biosynthesis